MFKLNFSRQKISKDFESNLIKERKDKMTSEIMMKKALECSNPKLRAKILTKKNN